MLNSEVRCCLWDISPNNNWRHLSRKLNIKFPTKGKVQKKTLPEAQRTQGIDSSTKVIYPAKKNATCIRSKFVSLISAQNLTNMWRHKHWFKSLPTCNAIWFQFWPPGGATCITYKFGHQMVPLVLVSNKAVVVDFELAISAALRAAFPNFR